MITFFDIGSVFVCLDKWVVFFLKSLSVKGRTPQLHQPPGSQKVFDSKEDNNAFKGNGA